MTGRRWMALFVALGSPCFLVGPFPGYVQVVGDSADAVTFFVGSVLFTLGGALQSRLAWDERRSPDGGRAAWWSAIVQTAGTLFFNVTTYQAMHIALTSPEYNKLVWRPDWRGSICFLVSGVIAYLASSRHGLLPARGHAEARARAPARAPAAELRSGGRWTVAADRTFGPVPPVRLRLVESLVGGAEQLFHTVLREHRRDAAARARLHVADRMGLDRAS